MSEEIDGQTVKGADFTLALGAQEALHRQICSRIKEAIVAGQLKAGDRLPSARTMATQLAVARGTVDVAYGVLAGEGYIVRRGSRGTVVAVPSASRPGSPPAQPVLRQDKEAVEAGGHSLNPPLPFQMGLPALDAFPRKLWSRLQVRAARAFTTRSMAYPNAAGLPELREAVSAYLSVSRGVSCTAQQVIITRGFQSALHLIATSFIHPGDAVWIEDPAYFKARLALDKIGAALVPIPVDADGIRVADGIAASPQARFVLVTPSHQSPTSVTLSHKRRAELLAWADQTQSWIIEDDYDSEFRYQGPQTPALKNLDTSQRVIYVGSFSKVLFPALRLGYMVAPDALYEPLLATIRLSDCGTSPLEQSVVAEFMKEGHFALHLNRMRTLYASRRTALALELQKVFGSRIRLSLPIGGMHLLMRFDPSFDDIDGVRRAIAYRLAPAPLSTLGIKHDCGRGLLLSFTNVPEERALALSQQLAQALEDRSI